MAISFIYCLAILLILTLRYFNIEVFLSKSGKFLEISRKPEDIDTLCAVKDCNLQKPGIMAPSKDEIKLKAFIVNPKSIEKLITDEYQGEIHILTEHDENSFNYSGESRLVEVLGEDPDNNISASNPDLNDQKEHKSVQMRRIPQKEYSWDRDFPKLFEEISTELWKYPGIQAYESNEDKISHLIDEAMTILQSDFSDFSESNSCETVIDTYETIHSTIAAEYSTEVETFNNIDEQSQKFYEKQRDEKIVGSSSLTGENPIMSGFCAEKDTKSIKSEIIDDNTDSQIPPLDKSTQESQSEMEREYQKILSQFESWEGYDHTGKSNNSPKHKTDFEKAESKEKNETFVFIVNDPNPKMKDQKNSSHAYKKSHERTEQPFLSKETPKTDSKPEEDSETSSLSNKSYKKKASYENYYNFLTFFIVSICGFCAAMVFFWYEMKSENN